ncbi:MAG: cysteine hydrolase [Rhodospirillaceae bacterium]|nr:cysteine hydrolase [Rhodospirillaceae bacterium]
MTDDKLKINPKKTALLLIDFQNDIASKGGILAPSDDDALSRFSEAINNAKRALDGARNAGVRIYHIRHCNVDENGMQAGNAYGRLAKFTFESGALVPGKPGYEFVSQLMPGEGEPIITKHTISAFVGTGLGETLNKSGVETVIISGLVTHWAAEGAVRSAHDMGFNTVILSDACSSGSIESHEQSLGRMGFIATSLTTDYFLSAILG